MKIHVHEKKYLLSRHHSFFSSKFFLLCIFAFIILVLIVTTVQLKKKNAFLPSVSLLYKDWEQNNYLSVYEKSGLILNKRPLDGSVLALHGFASYYLFTQQIDSTIAQTYLVSAITNLRNAWYRVSESEKTQIAYVLGKAYYQKGFFYADLAMKYLEIAKQSDMQFDDLSEFYGLSASLLGDYNTSVEAFIDALSKQPSDLLLFTLAQNYLNLQNYEKAKQYFIETIRTTKDELLVLKCRNMLGNVFLLELNYADAVNEFNTIIEKDPNFADAHYGLGVIYESQGDLIKARAEWRKAIRINPVHTGARLKLNI